MTSKPMPGIQSHARPASATSTRIALARNEQRGVVLPVVLIVLVIMTALVVTQVKRTTVDQRMAANAQESVTMDAAAKAVLGWCEYQIQRSNRGIAGVNRPRSMPALPAAAQAA